MNILNDYRNNAQFAEKKKYLAEISFSSSKVSVSQRCTPHPAGSLGFLSTTQMFPTWVEEPDRSSLVVHGASLSSGISSHHSKTTLRVNRKPQITWEHMPLLNNHTGLYYCLPETPSVTSKNDES